MNIELHRRAAPSLWAVIDDADFELVSQHRWFPQVKSHGTYAVANVRKADGRRTQIYMHTLVTGWSYVDHMDHDGLNNQRANLRVSNDWLNQANRRAQSGGTSQYKGVNFNRAAGRWYVRIKFGERQTWVGSFLDEVEAARAYDRAAREAFGEHACVSFADLAAV